MAFLFATILFLSLIHISIEREEIAQWLSIDHYTPEIIELALREAVLSQAYSLKYIDRILLNWQRHNLKTTDEVERFLKRNR